MRNFTGTVPHNTSRRTEFAPPPSDHVDARVLAASTAERHTIPAGAKYVSFAATGDFYVKFGDGTVTAAVPSGDITDGSGSDLNPGSREIPADATHISLIAAAAVTVVMSFYEL
ncbi:MULTISPECIES: hypothetical protein [Aurantimonas]|uniref:hypothetical protein n=1 Tax=Aurantimonas TaxID=182269 RepID=UPI0035192A68